ncbi:MAG: rod shape-determining protein MreD [Spirochaeta sp. LUC14_002_19_P3]|nr:MAG: rod shape-determining protein MreD [Spirochaeta sp. LUC14_002_19_P3]
MKTILVIFITSTLGVLQSVLLVDIMPMGIVPDLALVLLLAASCRYGRMTGVIAGFFVGLTFDIMGLAPLGFHAFIYTIIGYLSGLLDSSITSGLLFLPVLITLAASALKYGGAYLLKMIIGLNPGAITPFLKGAAIEAGVNALLAPLIFWLLHIITRAAEERRGGFH